MMNQKAQKLYRGEMKLFTEEGKQSTKVQRVKALRAKPPRDTPSCYRSNSDKENLALQYVEDFNKQLVQIYPSRKDVSPLGCRATRNVGGGGSWAPYSPVDSSS
jgi:hypothetical protein